MNKKQTIKLTESKIQKIVEESIKKFIKEEYSTPSLNDRIKYADYSSNWGDSGSAYDENANNLREIYQKLCKLEDFASWAFEDAANGQEDLKRYFDYILKCLNRGISCFHKVIKINQMNTGIQPETDSDSPYRYVQRVDVYDPQDPNPSRTVRDWNMAR